MFVPTVAVRLYRPIASVLEARGLPADEIFAEFGVPPPAMTGWDVRVPLPQIAGIWDRLLAITGDRFFALAAAELVDLTTCDVITFLEGNARTVGDALAKKFEYLALITDAIAWTLEVGGEDAVLTLHERPPRPPLAPVAEFLIGSRHIFFSRFGPPDWRLRSVRFRHPAPDATGEFARIFGVMPSFEAADDQIVFPASLLEAPMRGRDDALAELLGRYAAQVRSHARPQLPSLAESGAGHPARRAGPGDAGRRRPARCLHANAATHARARRDELPQDPGADPACGGRAAPSPSRAGGLRDRLRPGIQRRTRVPSRFSPLDRIDPR